MLNFATLVLVVVTLVEGDTPTPTHKLLIIEAAIAGDFDRVQVLLNLHNELRGLNSLSGQSSIPVDRSREPPVSRQNLLPYLRAEQVQGVSSSEYEQPLNQVSFPVLIPANISILGQVLIPGKTPTSDQISGSTPIFLPGSNGPNPSIKYNPTASNSRYQTEDTSGGVLDNKQFGNNNPLQYSGPPFNAGEVVDSIRKPPTGDDNPYYPAVLHQYEASPIAGSNSPNAYNPTASYSTYQPEDTSGGFLNNTQLETITNNPFNNSRPPFNTGNVTNMEPPAGRQFDETSPKYYNPYKPAYGLLPPNKFGNTTNNPFNNSWPPFNAGEVATGKPYYTREPIDSTPTLKKESHYNPYYPAVVHRPGASSFAGSNSPNAYNPTASYSRYQPEDTSGGFLNNTQFGNNNPFNNSWPPFNTGNVTNMKPPAGGQFDEESPSVKRGQSITIHINPLY